MRAYSSARATGIQQTSEPPARFANAGGLQDNARNSRPGPIPMNDALRADGRTAGQLRPVTLTRRYTRHAEGSVLAEFGATRVLCTASVESSVPYFLRGSGRGWITAEYGMLPRATGTRMDREATRGRQGGRTMEIQRLIGRSLRAAVDMSRLGEHSIKIDCDVIQADGGTRTAAITGACVALVDALEHMLDKRRIRENPFKQLVAAVSVGLRGGRALLDLDYPEDSAADTDLNVVMTEHGGLIEVQGTAEQGDFSRRELNQMLDLAEAGIANLVAGQRQALAE